MSRPAAQIDEDAFRRAWADGIRLIDMAEKFGIGESAISVRAKRMGLPSRKHGRPRVGEQQLPGPEDLGSGRWVRGRFGVARWEPNQVKACDADWGSDQLLYVTCTLPAHHRPAIHRGEVVSAAGVIASIEWIDAPTTDHTPPAEETP